MQTNYQDQSALPALEGGLYDPGFDQYVESRTPGGNVKQVDTIVVDTVIAEVAQVELITITTAADADAFTVWIDGVIVATGTSAGTDKTVQRDALEALLEANTYFAANFTWTDSAADAGEIRAVDPSRSFTVAIDITATSVWTRTTPTPYVAGTQFELTLDGHIVRYGCTGTTEETESDAFKVILLADSFVTDRVDVAEGSDANITLTAKTAGVPFTASLANRNESGVVGSGTISMSTTTPNQTGNPVPFGRVVARSASAPNTVVLPSATGFVVEGMAVNRAKARPRVDFTTGDAEYRGDEPVPVLRKGRIWVIPETSPASLAASVYVRHTQGADSEHTVGRVRGTDDSGKVDAWTAARWVHGKTPSSLPVAGELAVIEFSLP